MLNKSANAEQYNQYLADWTAQKLLYLLERMEVMSAKPKQGSRRQQGTDDNHCLKAPSCNRYVFFNHHSVS